MCPTEYVEGNGLNDGLFERGTEVVEIGGVYGEVCGWETDREIGFIGVLCVKCDGEGLRECEGVGGVSGDGNIEGVGGRMRRGF